jgi:hypothetical protein
MAIVLPMDPVTIRTIGGMPIVLRMAIAKKAGRSALNQPSERLPAGFSKKTILFVMASQSKRRFDPRADDVSIASAKAGGISMGMASVISSGRPGFMVTIVPVSGSMPNLKRPMHKTRP